MEKTSLKAREIEALTFEFTDDDEPSRAAGGDSSRGRWFGKRPATVGLTAAVVLIAALAWVMFSP